jgi:hypothetical protein
VSLSVAFRDPTGPVTQTRTITFLDRDEPPPRSVEITITTDADSSRLRPGQGFAAEIWLSSPLGALADIRQLRLDASASAGVSINEWVWDLASLTSPLAYAFETDGVVFAADYQWQGALPGLTLALTPEAQRIARLALTYEEPGRLSLLGEMHPVDENQSTRIRAGFSRVREFTPRAGTVTGGILPLPALRPTLRIVETSPPSGAMDARAPLASDPPGRETNWALELFFDGDAAAVDLDEFTLRETSGREPAPTLRNLVPINGTAIRLELSAGPRPGAWEILTHVPSGATIHFGHLPADVDSDATSDAADAAYLAQNLAHPALTLWSADIDRSGWVTPYDIVAEIDLLNGADGQPPWNKTTLVQRPHP